jgi:predicted RNase H-related nuclease YkuK (DUF458 family)
MNEWRTLSGKTFDKPIVEVVEEILVQEINQGYIMKVCIGTDSQVHSKTTKYATVIVFLREGKGGFMLIKTSINKQNVELKERMIIEVSKSIEIAYQLSSLFEKLDVKLEVHADINTDPNFKSNIAFTEAMGYIKGMGFTFKAKPFAFASSSCADKIL